MMNFGYSNPKISRAAIDQAIKLPLTGTYHISPLYTEFAKRVTKVMNISFSGSEKKSKVDG